jgi:hypothetical protein
MARPRASVAHLELTGVQRSKIAAHSKDKQLSLANRAQLEKVFADLQRSYRIAAADVNLRGEVIEVTRYSSKGTPFTVEVFNPHWKVMTKAATSMAAIAKLLSQYDEPKSNDAPPKPGSARALAPHLFKPKDSVS